MRPATMEARKLCEVFCNPSSNAREKLGALRNATIAHSRLVKECAQGKGVDRHLFALKCIAEKNGLQIPEFFRSESWKKLNHTILSTSNCGNPSLALFGFGPVVSTIVLLENKTDGIIPISIVPNHDCVFFHVCVLYLLIMRM